MAPNHPPFFSHSSSSRACHRAITVCSATDITPYRARACPQFPALTWETIIPTLFSTSELMKQAIFANWLVEVPSMLFWLCVSGWATSSSALVTLCMHRACISSSVIGAPVLLPASSSSAHFALYRAAMDTALLHTSIFSIALMPAMENRIAPV